MAQGPNQGVDPIAWANDIRGFADQQPLWGEFVVIEPLLREFVLGNVNIAPFAGGFNETGLVNGARVLCHGRQGNVPADDQLLLLATIGESLFPRLRNRRLDEDQARELLRMSVSQTLDYPDPDVAAAILAKTNQLYPNQPDEAAREQAIREGTPENAMQILVAGMNAHRRKFPTFGTEMLIHTMLAILKTGECSVDFLGKVMEGCRAFGFHVNLDRDLVKTIYLTFGGYINSRDVWAMVAYWKTLVPNDCLRIKLTIEQAEWHNLTSFVCIRSALTLHKSFYWANIFQLHAYNAQLAKYRIAMDLIQDDPYYGFNNNLGEASSTRYKDLAGACILLLIKVDNDKGLRKFKGLANKINNFPYIKFLIRQYMKATVTRAQGDQINEAQRQAVVADLLPVIPGFTIDHVQVCNKAYKPGDDSDSDED